MSYTIIMVIMICVGCAAGLAGLGVLAWRGLGLFKTAKKVGINSRADLQVVTSKVQGLAPRIAETAAKQREVAERLQDLSATVNNLRYLQGELDAATGSLSGLKS